MMMRKFFQDVNKKEAFSWAFFDFANSSYAILILSFVFPIYFKEVIAGDSQIGDFWWGLCISISILASGIASPIIGAIADYDHRRKSKFIICTLLAIAGTASLYFTGPNTLFLASVLFIISNFFYGLSTVLYDAFLPHVSTNKTAGRISGLGWGLGYIGGIAAMLLLQPFFKEGFAGDLDSLYRLTLPMVAIFFLLFSLPSFFLIKEDIEVKNKKPLLASIKIGIKNVRDTIKDIKKHKNVGWFLIAFYFLNDALVTIFAFLPIYAKGTLGFTVPELTILLLIVQLIGFPTAIFFGWLSDKKGSKKILLCTIVIWALILIASALATSKEIFYFVALLTGFVIGSSQAIARSWLSKIIPPDKKSEFFGFNAFASKISATTGPLLFGTISAVTSNQRIAMIALLPFFIIAFIIFAKIKEESIYESPRN